VFALLAATLGAIVLAEYSLAWDAGVDAALFKKQLSTVANISPARIAFPAALGTLGLGLGILLLEVRLSAIWLSEVCAVTTIQVAMLGLLGHVFAVPELYGSFERRLATGMSVHTAAGLLILSAGLMCARPNRGLMAVLRSHTPGGTMARRWMIVPPAMLVTMGVVYFGLTRAGGASRAFGNWSLLMTSLLVLTGAIWGTAEILYQAGLERDAAQRTLEQRVQERTAELNGAYEALNGAKEELARANQDLEKTVRERTQHLNETIRSLETVCYNIAHDLRAPNRAIAGFAEVLLAEHADPLDEIARDCLRRISLAAQRSDALTLDLLAYGRLGHANLPCSSQSLKAHVQAVLHKLSPVVADAKASVEVREPLPDVKANPTALEQVLTNLLTNALKFVAPGVQPHITIHVEDTGPSCRIMVEDNGIGIPPEHQQNIFGVFQRLHGPEEYPGSGIGLAIVQKSVERMGGKVGVDSTTEQGSRFWFELPKP
jgi:signal transduction histidine kinase